MWYKDNIERVFDLAKKKDFDGFFKSQDVEVGVINYELSWRRKDLLKLKGFTLMLDESSLIQNPSAKQTKFIMKMKPENVILLSGTPTAGKYQNLWTQAQLLGWNIKKSIFDQTYVRWKTIEAGGFVHRIVDKDDPYINVDRLKNKFREHGALFKKTEEVIDLPEQTFIDVNVPVSKEYKKFMKDDFIELDDGTELIGDTLLTKRLYARQLCSIYSKDKLEAFKDLLEGTSDRVVVFYNFNDELELLKGVCDTLERPYSQVNGSVKDLFNYEEKDDSVTLVQYQAGAMGINLQKSNLMVFFSPTERVELYMQAQKRTHRIGQKNTCFYYRMKCKGSIDEKIYDALDVGVDFTNDLFIQSSCQ